MLLGRHPGIDLLYYGSSQSQLEFDFIVNPGADPANIRMLLQGADSVSLDAQGDLVLHTANGDIVEHAPRLYQEVNGVRQTVSGGFVLLGANKVGFKVGAYDKSLPLFIDPLLSYSSYLGGSASDQANGIAVDAQGNTYVTGVTQSTSFPTTAGAYQTSNAGNSDVFVTKLGAQGNQLVYSTYLGGSLNENGNVIAVDAQGNAYLTGQAQDSGFPTTPGAYKTTIQGYTSVFVTKLGPSGNTLVYSTFLGGTGMVAQNGFGIAVDGQGDAFIAGNTNASNFPTTTGAFQTSSGGGTDAFVTEMNPAGSALVYSTYLGGSGSDTAYGIALDSSGDAFVAGSTSSSNFPTKGAFQTSSGGGTDAFISKLNSTGTSLVYSSYLGGSGADQANAVAVDSSGDAYLTGSTASSNFPTTTGAFQTSSGGGTDAFVTKVNPAGTTLTYSTYLGGSGTDTGYGVAVDSAGDAFVAGSTTSTNFPTQKPFQSSNGGGTDAFISKLVPAGNALAYSSYLGGSGTDIANALAIDGFGNAYLAGSTTGSFTTTTGAFQTTYGGNGDAFVSKVASWGLLTQLRSSDPVQGTMVPFGAESFSPNTGNLQVSHPLDFNRTVSNPAQDHGQAITDAPALVYNSETVNVQPIVEATFQSDPADGLPTQIQAQLTWNNGTPQSWVTFSTTGHSAGDFYDLALQVASAVTATGSYPWKVEVKATLSNNSVIDLVSTGTAHVVVNGTSDPFGPGWTVAGDDQLFADSGGVLWARGAGDSRYFTAPASGNTYISPLNDFGTLVKNGDGSFTYTAKDQTKFNFNSSGLLTTVVNPDSLTVTLGYASGLLSTVAEPDGGVGTFSYSSGLLSTVQEPGSRTVTLTHNGSSDLTGITNPDAGLRSFSYDTVHRMTNDQYGPLNATIGYDATSGLLNSLNRGLGSTLSVTPANVQGLQTSPAKLAGGAVGVLTDALSQLSTYTLDGLGRTTQLQTPDGASQSWVRDLEGQPVAYTDALNRTTTMLYQYGSGLGDLVNQINPDGSVVTLAYEQTFHHPTLLQDTLGHRTTLAYSSTTGDLLTTTNALNQVTTLAWSSGLLQSVTDPLNHTTTLQYDSATRRLLDVVNALNNRTTLGYDSAGNPITVQDALGRVTTTSFDAMRRPVQVTNAANGVSSVAYNAIGEVTSSTDPLGRVTNRAFDQRGLETTLTEAAGTPVQRTTTLGYDALLRRTSVTDALNHTTSVGYDAVGRPVTQTNALGGVTTSAYDLAGQRTSLTDPLGHSTTFSYNVRGWETSVTQSVQQSTSITSGTIYDTEGNVLSTTDGLGNRTSYAYDALNRLAGTTDALSHLATLVYDAAGNVSVAIDQLGRRATFAYDALNRRIQTTDPLTHVTSTAYDAVGNVLAQVDALGFATTMTYDALNRVIAVQDPGGGVATTAYDAVSNVVNTIDQLGQKTTLVYDSLNRQIQAIDARGGVTSTAYDAVGNVVNVIDPVGNKTTFVFDALNRQTQETDPLGHSWTVAYDAASRAIGTTDRNGNRRSFSYDNANRLLTDTWTSGGSTVNILSYSYDNNGNVLTAANYNGTYTMTFDALNRLATQQEPFGLTLTLGYDAVGNRTSVQDSFGGTTTSVYDAANRLTTREFGGSGPTPLRADLGYTARDQLSSVTRYSDLAGSSKVGSSSYSYDSVGRATNIQHLNGTGGVLANFTYTYDLASRLISDITNGATTSYGYDAANQLTTAGTATYGYDLNGNRTMTGYQTGPANQVSNDGTWTYTYDSEGNLTKKSKGANAETWTYGYDNLNYLTSAKDSASDGGTTLTLATYSYDVFGGRTEKDVWTQSTGTVVSRFGYDGQEVWADLNGSNALQTRYLRGDIVDQLFARIGSGGAAWYLTDREGSVRNLTDSSGTLQDTIAYDAYGNVTSESNSTAGGAYKYTGLRSDSETGFLATPNRYYNPATGSWVGQDPAGFKAGDPNLYRYVGNSPMDATDPSGLAPGNGLQFMLGQMGSTPTQASVAALASIIAANSPSLASGKGGFMGSGIPAQMKLMALASIVGAMQGQGIEPDLFTKITSGGAGFGDGLTGGGTKYLRKWMGIDAVDYNSGWYTGMNYAGTAYGIGLSFVNPCAVGGMAGMGLRGVSGLQAVGAAGSAGDNFSQGHYVAGSMDALAAIMSASQAGRACFAAGTPLLTPEGDKPIEQFRPGDLILSAPEEDPEAPPQARQVEEVFTNYAALLNLHVGAKVIRTTSAHPFYIKDKGWVKAQELQKGDLLHSHDGQWVPVQAVTDSGEQTPVYNLRVADYHTYFVGEDDWGFSVWAHNACAEPIQNRPAHGDTWHNATGTGRASQLEAQYGQGNVRWNQGLVNAQGVSIPGKRPDIQYIVGGQVHIIELQSPGQSATYMTGMEDLYQSLLGGNFGSYSWIAHP